MACVLIIPHFYGPNVFTHLPYSFLYLAASTEAFAVVCTLDKEHIEKFQYIERISMHFN